MTSKIGSTGRSWPGRRRHAFTLVELLTVIAIIAILAGLASWAVIAMVGSQSRRNTENTIRTVNKVLMSQWQYVIEEAKKDDISTNAALQALAAPDPDGRRARVLWIKFRLMEAFPQSYADISAPFVYSPDPNGIPYIPFGQRRYIATYQKALASPPFVAAKNVPATQSAACLLIALSVSRGGTMLAPDQISYAAVDTDGDGIKELVDGWSPPIPLGFARFVVPLPGTNPATTPGRNTRYADPVDPDGLLVTSNWYGSSIIYLAPDTARTFYEKKFGYAISPDSLNANYVIPAMVSPGKDRNINTPDDIISYQLRLD